MLAKLFTCDYLLQVGVTVYLLLLAIWEKLIIYLYHLPVQGVHSLVVDAIPDHLNYSTVVCFQATFITNIVIFGDIVIFGASRLDSSMREVILTFNYCFTG